MDTEQMNHRCRDAELEGPVELPGYRFLVNTRGVATIVADESARVLGILWKISPADESELDIYEGVRWDTYYKRDVEVNISPEETVSALAYIARDEKPGSPRNGYVERIIQAAERHGLPDEYIDELRTWAG